MATTTAATPGQEQSLVPAKNQAVRTIEKILEIKKQDILNALPQHIRFETWSRVALTTYSGDSKLQKCDPISVGMALMEAAQLGLVIEGVRGEAYLVPFFNKRKNVLEAKFMPGYRGLIKLAIQTNRVIQVRASVVYDADLFEYDEGLNAVLKHRPAPPSKRKEIIGAYSVCELKDTPRDQNPFKFMWREEIEDIRKRSPNGSDDNGNPIGVWKSDWEEMAKKTTVRAMMKYLNLSPELTRVAVMDEYNEAGVTIDGGSVSFHEDEPSAKPTVPNITEAAGNGLREKIAAAKNGEAKPAAAAASSAPAAAAAEEKVSDPYTMKLGENLFAIRGTVSKLFMPKADAPKPKVDVYMGGEKMSTFDTKFFPSLSNARGKMCILNYALSSDGKFKNIVNVQKVDETEFVDGLPVQQLDRGQNDVAPAPKAAPVAKQESAAQPDDGPDPDDSDNFGR